MMIDCSVSSDCCWRSIVANCSCVK